jgi:methionine salvage enolase-phosphatase E1
MHIGLIKYLNVELRKKRTPKELVYFLWAIIKRYFQVNLQEFKNLFRVFDPEYNKQKKEFEKQQDIKKDLQRALRILQYVDSKMAKSGKSRQERRRFWRQFYKDGQIRNETFKDLEKEIG